MPLTTIGNLISSSWWNAEFKWWGDSNDHTRVPFFHLAERICDPNILKPILTFQSNNNKRHLYLNNDKF